MRVTHSHRRRKLTPPVTSALSRFSIPRSPIFNVSGIAAPRGAAFFRTSASPISGFKSSTAAAAMDFRARSKRSQSVAMPPTCAPATGIDGIAAVAEAAHHHQQRHARSNSASRIFLFPSSTTTTTAGAVEKASSYTLVATTTTTNVSSVATASSSGTSSSNSYAEHSGTAIETENSHQQRQSDGDSGLRTGEVIFYYISFSVRPLLVISSSEKSIVFII